MSIVVMKGDKISRHPCNTSLAKQLFSFPRSKRFKDQKSEDYRDAVYDVLHEYPKCTSKNPEALFGMPRPELFSNKGTASVSRISTIAKELNCLSGKREKSTVGHERAQSA